MPNIPGFTKAHIVGHLGYLFIIIISLNSTEISIGVHELLTNISHEILFSEKESLWKGHTFLRLK